MNIAGWAWWDEGQVSSQTFSHLFSPPVSSHSCLAPTDNHLCLLSPPCKYVPPSLSDSLSCIQLSCGAIIWT